MSAYLLQQLLHETASRLPDKVAVRFGQESLSYGELDRLTDRVAGLLRAHRVRRGDRVGILLHKSIASVVSIFAILKAGGVYVPLDPNSPARRSAFAAQDCGIGCLLAGGDLLTSAADMAAAGAPIELVVVMNQPDSATARAFPFSVRSAEDAAASSPGADAGGVETDLAYILYTSGSTGQPKGVMISHRNAFTFVNWAASTFAIAAEDVLSNHAPLHFDLSIFDIFAAVQAGATIAPVPEGLSTFPIRLSQWIADNRITIWYSVPSVLTMLVMHGALPRWDLSALRTLLFAGEVFPVRYLRQLTELVPHPEYFNLYGPTETNVITYYRVGALEPARTQPIPIGKACENMEVFCLSDAGDLVTEPGVECELYGRGAGVALGYWGRPDKTAELFVQNPLHSFYVDRVYRTGDIVALDESGDYLYRGRRDHMVKSRGYRIELGEIEATLYGHPGVKEAAVVAVPDEVIGHRLQAYVVAAAPQGLTPEEVQRHCRDRLPGYMVPERIALRAGLPKTSNGKVDRVSLAAQAAQDLAPESA